MSTLSFPQPAPTPAAQTPPKPTLALPAQVEAPAAGPSNQQQQPPQPSTSTAPAQAAAPRPGSPIKAKPVVDRPALDLRAEEDAARRLNIGKAAVSGRPNDREKATLMPVDVIRQQLTKLSADKSIQFDEEALHYLALSAESHLRTLLTSTLSAQVHRTTSTHTRPAPIRHGKAMWSHTATSDPLALMQAMNAQLKAGEQAFRQDRMHRIQKEKDVAARTISLPAATGSDGLSLPAPGTPGTPGTPGGAVGAFAPGPSATFAGGAAPSTPGPVFGGVTPKPKKSTAKKKEHSTEAQHKMSNQTAMRQAFGTKKQYSWMQTMPSQPSPLGNKGGKKRKHALATVENGDGDGDEHAAYDGLSGGVKRENEPPRSGQATREGTPVSGGGTPNKDGLGRSRAGTPSAGLGKRIKLTEPTRRQVVVCISGGVEKTISDDRAITIKDALFVLDRDRVGRGMGWGEAEHDDLVRRAWTLGEGVVTAAAVAAEAKAKAAAAEAAAKRAAAMATATATATAPATVAIPTTDSKP